MQKSILVSLLTVGLLASVIGVGTYAYFSDTETSVGNTMTAGTLDLSVNDQNPLATAVVTVGDLKPSLTRYSDTIKLVITDNPGKLYKRISAVSCKDGANPEPEWAADPTHEINDFSPVTWFDLEIWDQTLNDGKGDWKVLIPDGTASVGRLARGQLWIYLGQYDQLVPVYIRQSFHMDAEAGNEYQGDICTFTEEFMVLQTNDDTMDALCDEAGEICRTPQPGA